MTKTCHLTESHLREPSGPEGLPAIIRAAKSPNSFEALLKLNHPEKSASYFLKAESAGYYTCSLHEAIKATIRQHFFVARSRSRFPRNLQWTSGSSRFPAIPSREEALAMILQKPQIDPLTAEEVEARRSTRARSWPEASMLAFGPGSEAMTALEAVAESETSRA